MLKFNNKEPHPVHRLPFIGGKSKNLAGCSFWNVPATGGYEGGNMTGNAMAWLWLKHIEANGPEDAPAVLSRIVMEIANAKSKSLNGQIVGFFEVIEIVISKLITDYKIHFTKEEISLLEQANSGLSYTENEVRDDIHQR